jgi:hypothetical protein
MKILLYRDWPLAVDYLDPIEDKIRQRHPDWKISKAGFDVPLEGDGFDWVVSCDELSAAPRGRRNLCVFHGMASKGQAFSTARREAFVDTDTIFAVPGPHYAKILTDMGVPVKRVHVTGLSKLDGFTRNVLFAPTHNPQLSAIPVVSDRILELGRIRVRLHMWTMQGSTPHHAVLRAYYPEFSDNPPKVDLEWADTVIGDFGSIIVEAIALGKQAIQVVNPEWKKWYRGEGLTDEEIAGLPEVYYPERYATRCHSFEDLRDALNIMPLGDSTGRIVDIMERNR